MTLILYHVNPIHWLLLLKKRYTFFFSAFCACFFSSQTFLVYLKFNMSCGAGTTLSGTTVEMRPGARRRGATPAASLLAGPIRALILAIAFQIT